MLQRLCHCRGWLHPLTTFHPLGSHLSQSRAEPPSPLAIPVCTGPVPFNQLRRCHRDPRAMNAGRTCQSNAALLVQFPPCSQPSSSPLPLAVIVVQTARSRLPWVGVQRSAASTLLRDPRLPRLCLHLCRDPPTTTSHHSRIRPRYLFPRLPIHVRSLQVNNESLYFRTSLT